MYNMSILEHLSNEPEFWTGFYISDTENVICNTKLLPWACETTDSLLDVIYNNRESILDADRFLFEYVYSHRDKYTTPVNLLLSLKSGDVLRLIFTVSDSKITGMLYRNLDSDVIDSMGSCSSFSSYICDVINNNPDKHYAVIQVDIEKFKIINDSYGDAVGDKILKSIANKLCILLGNEQDYTRLGSDIFVALCEYTDVTSLVSRITEWDELLSQCDGITYRLAWGIYLADSADFSGRTMIDSATIARQNVKGNAINNIGFYEETQKAELRHVRMIESCMRDALVNGEYKVWVQPKYSATSETIVGGESLIRWIKADGTIIYPTDFIPIFEQNGFITEIDRFVWRETCAALRRWKDEGLHVVPISVNMSRKHFENIETVDYIENLIKEFKLPRNLLELEITETLESVCECDTFIKLKQLGYTLLMDDFGSGYSSLNTLKSTNFDKIKMDKEFLSEFLYNPRGQKIISHTISMVKDINLDIIAEGVETKEQAEFLRKNGCDVIQGYYFAKPMNLDSFEELLKSTT
jgi:EAL domain-containing protein (putative c-di-GMP-specific phosphodiesterase class I)/GGDEF domain-containing protein